MLFMAGLLLAGAGHLSQMPPVANLSWECSQGLPKLPLAREVQKDTECGERAWKA